MVAVAQAPPADLRRLVLVRTTPVVRYAVAGTPAATYRRRRAAAAALVLGLLMALVIGVHSLLGSVGGAASASSRGVAVAGPVHVVQPGDTFWDIARALRPNDDPRPLVARLVAAHGSAVLVVGQRIPLPPGG
ncbi:MAG TPA: LysM domain-containing protein [Acidimicrobiales bacterium]|jgi:hypothetical protein|nr:LysM domain-containing protein [Acidimicrobiales bacterium]